MTTSAIRKKPINYISEADDKKIWDLYLIFEQDIEKDEDFILNEDHLQILEEEREKHLSGKSKAYNLHEAKDIITGERSNA